ncbi:MAG: hypothetical protein NZ482_07980 [Gloeomargarita sp. SKYG98]|nr:hypothetical protein [Gloeomargarita sp. SKYG98]
MSLHDWLIQFAMRGGCPERFQSVYGRRLPDDTWDGNGPYRIGDNQFRNGGLLDDLQEMASLEELTDHLTSWFDEFPGQRAPNKAEAAIWAGEILAGY